jgi:hypothetical protein
MNAINVIWPYKHHGMWVFDDARVALVQEPFVSGADTFEDAALSAWWQSATYTLRGRRFTSTSERNAM